MGTEAISSALRLELRPGEWVLWEARPYRFESLLKDRARIRDATTGELREVSAAALRALPYLPAADLDARLDRHRTIDPDQWSLAERREAAIREALTGDGPTRERVRVAAVALGMSSRAAHRLVARYRISAQTTGSRILVSVWPRRVYPQQNSGNVLSRLGSHNALSTSTRAAERTGNPADTPCSRHRSGLLGSDSRTTSPPRRLRFRKRSPRIQPRAGNVRDIDRQSPHRPPPRQGACLQEYGLCCSYPSTLPSKRCH
jgi:hypothetical protein